MVFEFDNFNEVGRNLRHCYNNLVRLHEHTDVKEVVIGSRQYELRDLVADFQKVKDLNISDEFDEILGDKMITPKILANMRKTGIRSDRQIAMKLNYPVSSIWRVSEKLKAMQA